MLPTVWGISVYIFFLLETAYEGKKNPEKKNTPKKLTVILTAPVICVFVPEEIFIITSYWFYQLG